MIWHVMLYAVGVTVALSLMGFCKERVAFLRGIARRWVWPLMMLLSVVWVAGAMWSARPSAVDPVRLDVVVTPSGQLDVPAVPPSAASAAPAPITEDSTSGLPPALARSHGPSDRMLLGTWAAISALLLLSLLVAGALLRQRSAQWRQARVLGRNVMISESVGPALMGTWQPRIVVPEWFMTETPARQELILRHEEQHIAARDPLLLRAATLFVVALPWNLPLWWQLRRMRQAIEMDCDARVIRQGVSPVEYGTVLLAVTRRCANLPAGLVAMSEPASALEHRVRSLVADPARHAAWRTVAALLLWMVGVGVALGLEAPPMPQRAERSAPPLQTLAAPTPTGVQSPSPATTPPPSPPTRHSAAELPRLLPPPRAPARPARRELLETAIVERYPELVSGPERDGVAFVSVLLGMDESVEHTGYRYVEAGDAAGLDAAMKAALEPFPGQLLLARGRQIAGGATARSQIRVSYRTRNDPEIIRAQELASARQRMDLQQVVNHYLAGAMTDQGTAGPGTLYLIVSNDGRVLKSGHLAHGAARATFATLRDEVPNETVTAFSIMPRFFGSSAPDTTLVIGWVRP